MIMTNFSVNIVFLESFNIVLRGRGFTQGRTSEGVVCTLSVNQQDPYSKPFNAFHLL